MKARQVHDSVRASGGYRSDQGAIWDEISEKAVRMHAASPSMAMASIYEKEESSLQKYVNHFRLTDMQVGAVFAINGKVAGLDCFGKPATFSSLFKKLVQSYALDAIDWFEEGKDHKVLKGDVTKFLKASAKGTVESRLSVGLGTDFRLESKDLTGFALALDEVTLKKLYIEPDGIRLQPADAEMKPIIFHNHEIRILGLVVAVIRTYRFP